MTIHMIGKNPNAAPHDPTTSAWSTGMSKPATAITRATSSAATPEIHAVIRRTPSITNKVARGRAATSAEAVSDPPIASKLGW